MVVYGLSDPRTGELRYVGKTKGDMTDRLHSHVKDCKRYTNHCAHWIANLKDLGLKPVVEEIENCESEDGLDVAEIFWIEQFRALGCRLTNLAAGGGGTRDVRIPDEQRAKISKTLGGRAIQDHLGHVFLTKNEAAEKLGIARQQITRVLKGAEHQAKGFSFSYVGDPVPESPKWTRSDGLRWSRRRTQSLRQETI